MRFIIVMITILFAYKAKVEPFEIYKIKSSVAGSVVMSLSELEAKRVDGVVVKIDSKNEEIELKNIKNQIKILNEEIELQKRVVSKKLDTYKRYLKLKTKSIEEKNMKFYDYINAKNQLLSLKSNLSNLIATRDKLLDTISKKNIKIKGYLNKLYVKKGDYIAPGSLIAEVADIKKVKISVYIPIDDIATLPKSVIIRNKLFKVYKIWQVPDSKYITSYRVDFVGEGLKIGEVVDVKFKK